MNTVRWVGLFMFALTFNAVAKSDIKENQVLHNTNATSELRDEYYLRIKSGNLKDLRDVMFVDKNTPPDILDYTIRNAAEYRLAAVWVNLLNENLRTDTIDYMIDSGFVPKRNLHMLLDHQNISQNSLQRMVEIILENIYTNKGLLFSMLNMRVKGDMYTLRDNNLIQQLLLAKANSRSLEYRRQVAKDPRISNATFDALIKSRDIYARIILAKNKKISKAQIRNLVEDTYSSVRRAAINTMDQASKEDDYNGVYGTRKEIMLFLSKVTNLDESIREADILKSLRTAIFNKNIVAVNKNLSELSEANTIVTSEYSLSPALASKNIDMVALMLANFRMTPDSLFNDENFDSEWLDIFLKNNWLEEFDEFTVMFGAIKAGHWNYYITLAQNGYAINPISRGEKRSLLSTIIFNFRTIYYGTFYAPIILLTIAFLVSVSSLRRSREISFAVVLFAFVILFSGSFFIVPAIALSCWGCSNPYGTIITVWAITIAFAIAVTLLNARKRTNA